MKGILVLAILLGSMVSHGAADRYLDGKYITNGAATLTLPTTTDTLIGLATSDTLTNKTLTAPVLSGTLTGTYTLGGTPTIPSSALSGTVAIGSGGSGQTTANAAFNAFAPSQATHSGKFLTTNGTDTSWATVPSGAPTVTGSQASPTLITAVGGVSFSGSEYFNISFIAGDSGAIDVTANPQVVAGSLVGQQLILIATHATNTVTLEDGTGLLLNGTWVGSSNSALTLIWDGSNWKEISRR